MLRLSNPHAGAQAMRESALMRPLAHPHVLSFRGYEVIGEDHVLYIEYCPKGGAPRPGTAPCTCTCAACAKRCSMPACSPQDISLGEISSCHN